MKESLQQQAEQQEDMVIGPGGRPIMTPEAMARKLQRDRLQAEQASPPDFHH